MKEWWCSVMGHDFGVAGADQDQWRRTWQSRGYIFTRKCKRCGFDPDE